MATKRKTTTAEDVKKDRVRKAQAELAAALRDLAPEGSFAEWEEELLEPTVPATVTHSAERRA